MAKQTTNVKPPKRRTKPVLPPEENDQSQNLHKPASGETVQLKFRVDQEFRKEVKLYATEHDMTLQELFIKSFEFYKAGH